MASIHRRTAVALALLLCANIALALACELRCDVPAAPASIAACHGSASTAATSESPFSVGDGTHDRCEHDALPAGTIAAIKKDARGPSDAPAGRMPIARRVPALSSLARTDRSQSFLDHFSARTVLRI
jgi:hypothetical protein